MNKPSWLPYSIDEAATILGMERRHLARTLAPIMAPDYAYRMGSSWVFNPKYMHQWESFLKFRQSMINSGKWGKKRKYGVQDFEDWMHGGTE